MVVVVVVATVVEVVVVGEASVVAGSLEVVVVDIGTNVDVVDASSPEADWHPAATMVTAAIRTRARTICIDLRCYGHWRVKRSFVPRTVGILNWALHSGRGTTGVVIAAD